MGLDPAAGGQRNGSQGRVDFFRFPSNKGIEIAVGRGSVVLVGGPVHLPAGIGQALVVQWIAVALSTI